MTLSDDEILHEVVVSPRTIPNLPPETTVTERPGWVQRMTPGVRRGSAFNGIDLAVLEPADADRVIAETLAAYAALGVELRWLVGPGSAPADLSARLERAGVPRSASIGVARETHDYAPRARDPDVTIDEATADRPDLIETYARVMTAGWNDDLPARLAQHTRAAASGRENMFIARYRGEPAAGGGSALYPRSAYLHGGVVLPAFRGKGLYRALIDARIAAAHALGIPLVTSHAMAHSSAPLLAHMGFREVVRLDIFRTRV